MCLAETGRVAALPRPGVALVEFDRGHVGEVSTAVLDAAGESVPVGSEVVVTLGLVLHVATTRRGETPSRC